MTDCTLEIRKNRVALVFETVDWAWVRPSTTLQGNWQDRCNIRVWFSLWHATQLQHPIRANSIVSNMDSQRGIDTCYAIDMWFYWYYIYAFTGTTMLRVRFLLWLEVLIDVRFFDHKRRYLSEWHLHLRKPIWKGGLGHMTDCGREIF